MTDDHDDIPDAPIVKRSGDVVTVDCPYCARRHTHGALLGHRVAHCGQAHRPNDGYYLTDPLGLLPEEDR